MNCITPGFPVLHYLLELAKTHVHWLSDDIQPSHPCHPLLLLPSIFPSIRVFSSESALCISWPKYWSFSFSISPSNEYSEWFLLGLTSLISLQSKGLSRSLFHHHNLEASLFKNSVFFMVQFSHPYMTTGKTIPLTIGTFVGKVISLLFSTV